MFLWDIAIREEDLTGIFDRAEAVSVKVAAIPETAPDLEKVKAQRKDQSDNSSDRMSSSFAGWRTSCLWRFMERTERTVRSRRRLTCLASATQGTGYLGSALAMNKGMAKQLFLENGIPTPRPSLKRGEDAAKDRDLWNSFPCVVKPCSGGSSIGVSIVHDKAEYEQALKEAFRWENEIGH